MTTMLPKASDLLKQSWQIFKQKVRVLVLIQLLPFITIVPLMIALAAAGVYGSKNSAPEAGVLFWVIILVVIVLVIMVQLWAGIATLLAIDAPGEGIGFKEAFSRSRALILPYLGVSLLAGLIIFGGLVLFIIPGIIFAIWYCFSAYVVVLEGKRGMDALRTSKSYVQGRMREVLVKWAYLGVAAIVILGIPGMILEAFGLKGLGDIYGAVASLVFSPVAAIYGYLLFRYLREAKANEPANSATIVSPNFPSP